MSECIDNLLKKMDASPGFASLGGAVQTISRLVDDDGDNKEIVTTILRDPALTAKLLQVVNSSRYARGGGNVTTIDRALTVLGLNTVKSIALSLALCNSVSNKPQSNQQYAEIVAAFFSGSLAAEITRNNGSSYSVQEAQVCGLMQNLGRIMSLFYLYEDVERSRKLQVDENIPESDAILRTMGVSYDEIGAAIARHWQLPEVLLNSLAPDDVVSPPPEVMSNPMAWIRLCSLSSRRITEILFRLPVNREKIEISNCIKFFQRALKINEEDLLPWIEKSLRETDAMLSAMVFPLSAEDARKILRKANERATDMLLEGDSLVKRTEGETPIDVLKHRMRLIHDHCGFDCTMVCIPSGSSGMVAMAGVGRNATMLTTKFRSGGLTQDIFRVVMDRKQDAFVSDVDSPKYANLIPKWYNEFVKAKSFVMLPLVIEGKVIGMVYGDYDKQQASPPTGMNCGEMMEWRAQLIQILKPAAKETAQLVA